MYLPLLNYIENVKNNFENIAPKRKEILISIAQYIRNKKEQDGLVKLVFICTHNSRRSHFGHIWAQTAAHYYSIKNIHCYSGGTKASAFNSLAINALQNAGFSINTAKKNENPEYRLSFADNQDPITCFSKLYSHKINPKNKFVAIMTCSEADNVCPLIEGADMRFALNYKDPKIADGTVQESEVYGKRCLQIAIEMIYLFSSIREKND